MQKIKRPPSLDDDLNHFVEWGMTRYAIRTVDTYSDLIRRFVRFVPDGMTMETVTLNDIIGYYRHLRDRNCHDATIAYSMIALRQFFYLPQRRTLARCDCLFVSDGPGHVGHRLTTRSVQRIVEKVRERPNVSPHSFRHGLGLRAVKSGIHPRYIQKILGHRNITSSQCYMDTVDTDTRDAYRKIVVDNLTLATIRKPCYSHDMSRGETYPVTTGLAPTPLALLSVKMPMINPGPCPAV